MPRTLSRRVGLARTLSKMGHCSRSAAQELIKQGRVRLNGRTSRDPEKPVMLERDRIEVDGKTIRVAGKIYLIMNKPRGIVTTASDEKGRETVYSFLADQEKWVAPVGRLDKASEGLLLLTNDSEWAARISAPESHIDKTYHVQIPGRVSERLLCKLRDGVCESGELLRAKSAQLLRSGEKNCWIEIVLDEGKNRHIRRIFSALGIEVRRLVRVAIGELKLGDLAKGGVRELTRDEIVVLTR